MGDFFTSILEYYKTKVRSQVYGIFAFWWIVTHFDYFLALLFVDQNLIFEKTGLLKDEYLSQAYHNFYDPEFWIKFLAAISLTYLTVRVFPKIIFNPSYKIEKKFQYDRQVIRLDYEKRVQELEKQVVEIAVEKLKNQNKKEDLEEDLEKKKEKSWNNEYERFKKSTLYSHFDDIQESIYKRFGYIKITSGSRTEFSVDSDVLAYAHSNDLVEINNEEGRITLTSKGKFFMKRFQLESN